MFFIFRHRGKRPIQTHHRAPDRQSREERRGGGAGGAGGLGRRRKVGDARAIISSPLPLFIIDLRREARQSTRAERRCCDRGVAPAWRHHPRRRDGRARDGARAQKHRRGEREGESNEGGWALSHARARSQARFKGTRLRYSRLLSMKRVWARFGREASCRGEVFGGGVGGDVSNGARQPPKNARRQPSSSSSITRPPHAPTPPRPQSAAPPTRTPRPSPAARLPPS